MPPHVLPPQVCGTGRGVARRGAIPAVTSVVGGRRLAEPAGVRRRHRLVERRARTRRAGAPVTRGRPVCLMGGRGWVARVPTSRRPAWRVEGSLPGERFEIPRLVPPRGTVLAGSAGLARPTRRVPTDVETCPGDLGASRESRLRPVPGGLEARAALSPGGRSTDPSVWWARRRSRRRRLGRAASPAPSGVASRTWAPRSPRIVNPSEGVVTDGDDATLRVAPRGTPPRACSLASDTLE
ncbi:hypothetical protein DFJ64_1870 [Thermasporomyces composti]|uniref:Uncharacterized protein n=1 Tax=Thermasporomyces composti TaxID=696763 RepID=A0A3D9V3S4_THECX|nr:hypothetical protein DFJ64_1870 [Thermasporomyces composti]